MGALRELGEGSRAAALPLLLDAEQTHRQPAIGMLARALSREYNPPGAAPLLYNTHQAYLRGAEVCGCVPRWPTLQPTLQPTRSGRSQPRASRAVTTRAPCTACRSM